MSRRSVENKAKGLINELGRASAHYLFPNDIDYYFVGFELVDSEERTVNYFTFPVNPQNILFQDGEMTKIQRTLGGITTIKSSVFNPKDYTISGTFGRSFKIVVGGTPFIFSALNFDLGEFGFDFKNLKINLPELSAEIKSGYGCCKVLERILKKSVELDNNGKPYKLYFYNTSLNHQYLVESTSFNFSMNVQSNMIWNYNVRLRPVARVEDVRNVSINESLINSLALSSINRYANNVTRKITRSLL